MDSYKLVTVSLIAFFLFIILSYLLRKAKNYPFFLVIFSSLLPLASLLRRGVHQSGDFGINIAKATDLWNSLQFGIFPVHWASLLNATYGYPLFIFTYPLPYYSIVALKFLGISFIASEKTLIALVFVLSGIGMYLLAREFLKPINSTLAAILYVFAPYHLVDMHFRVAIGEMFAYAFLPLVFYLTYKLLTKSHWVIFLLLTLSYSALVLSHQAITIVSTPFIFLFPLLFKRNRKLVYFSLSLGILLTAFYWLPAVFEIQYTKQTLYAKSISFENISLFFVSPWRYGFLYQGPKGQLSFPMGFTQLFFLIFAIVISTKKKVRKHKKILFILIATFVFFVFLLFPFSLPLWKIMPLMTNFQFSYRLALPISFVLALIGGISSTKLGNRLVVVLIFISIGLTIINWGTRSMITDITDAYLIRHTPITTAEGEGLQAAVPKWRGDSSLWFENPPGSHLIFSKGEALIKSTTRTPIVHDYDVRAIRNSSFTENTLYFPGWNLYVNGKLHQFSVDEGKTGLIKFSLPQGVYKVSLRFEDTPVRKMGNTISLLAVAGILLYLMYHFVSQRVR